ncbi:hypothetical protein CSUI_009615, partial [Cystoisospora suis]
MRQEGEVAFQRTPQCAVSAPPHPMGLSRLYVFDASWTECGRDPGAIFPKRRHGPRQTRSSGCSTDNDGKNEYGAANGLPPLRSSAGGHR